jgi:hypothetical protein
MTDLFGLVNRFLAQNAANLVIAWLNYDTEINREEKLQDFDTDTRTRENSRA